jgi:mono/diheme cytochrome c family protein
MIGLALMKLMLLLAAGVVTASAMNSSALASRSAAQISPPRQDYYSGAYLYRVFCASCHGENGKGDGPVADTLRRPPADLTRVSARAGGVFPRNEVIAIIDGRKPAPGHGSTEMPVWGDVLRATQGSDDAIIAKRIAALVMHIQSIQTK